VSSVFPNRAEDAPSIARLMDLLYDAISFEEGSEPDWEGLGQVFSDHARITRITPEGTDYLDLPSFVTMIRNLVEIGAYTSFYEFELSRRVDRFGDVAQVWSTYETRRSRAARDALGRGVNSIQLVREQGTWKVLGLLWDETLSEALATIPAAALEGAARGQE